jgi:hypothetical protein
VNPLVIVKTTLLVAGLAVWVAGYVLENRVLTGVGMVLLIAAVVLRVAGRRRGSPGASRADGEPTA